MSLLTNRHFRLLWFVHLAATLAQELCSISVVVLVFSATGSTLQATGVLVARSLPPLLLGPIAGSIVDRLPRRTVLVAANLLRAALVVAMLFGDTVAPGRIWLGYALVFCLTLVDIVHKPALQASLPAIVPKAQLVRANSLIFSTTQVAFTVSYTLGGIAVANGRTLLLFFTMSLFLVAGLAAALTGTSLARPAANQRASFWRMAIEGFAYLRDHRMARTLITVEFLESWPHGVWTSVLMLTFTKQALGAGTDAWGYQSGAFFAGQFIGAFLALAFASRLSRRPGWIIILNGFLMAALTLGYAASTTVVAATIISMAFGPPFALRDVAQDSLLQTTVEPGMLGRIYAAREMFARMAFLIGGLVFATLADFIPIRSIYVIAAALYACTSLYTLASATLRRSQISAAAPLVEF
jgi:MFS family permease